MNNSARVLAVVSTGVALGLAVTACGADEPVDKAQGFHLESGDKRGFAAYRQTSSERRDTMRLAAGTQHVRVRLDCVGTGEITVDVFGGTVGAPCREDSAPGGYIGMEDPKARSSAGSTDVVVRVRKGTAVWSVVVDAGPGPIDQSTED